MKSIYIALATLGCVALLAAHAEAPAGASVSLEGCVVDAADQPLAIEVRAENGAGEVIAQGHSGRDGLFRLEVPARSGLMLRAGEALRVLHTEDTALAVETCLQRPR